MKASACVIAIFVALTSASSLQAQFSVGTWVQTAPMEGLTMTVESRFDGSDAPVLVDGKPNGETMALKRVDERRTTTVFKRSGKVFRTSTTAESAERMTLTVENEFIDPGDGRVTGKMTETYVRK